jgi:hypothetical protein
MREQQARGILLGAQPELLGESWARIWFQTLQSEGRAVAGGWPGTVQEARFRAKEHFDRELLRCGFPPLNSEELHAATSATYERAKSAWLRVIRESKQPKSIDR